MTFDKATSKAQLANPVVAQLVLKPDSDGQPYVEGQDYSLDAQTGDYQPR